MRVRLIEDEWYPVWYPCNDWGKEYEVPAELLERYNKSRAGFQESLNELSNVIRLQVIHNPPRPV